MVADELWADASYFTLALVGRWGGVPSPHLSIVVQQRQGKRSKSTRLGVKSPARLAANDSVGQVKRHASHHLAPRSIWVSCYRWLVRAKFWFPSGSSHHLHQCSRRWPP